MTRTGATFVALLTMIFAFSVSTASESTCLSRFETQVNSLYAEDEDCMAALLLLTNDVITLECTEDVKRAIETCINKHETEWKEFSTDCSTVGTSQTPSPDEETESSAPAPAPAPNTESSATTPSPSESATTTETEVVSSEEPMSTVETMESESAPARRLLRMFLEKEEEEIETRFDQFKRALLETEIPTCQSLLAEQGLDAFRNGAASISLSIISVIGSILLGLMLI